MQRLIILVGALWVLALSGCGWQLQADAHLAGKIAPVYLQMQDEHSDFARALTSRLRAAKVQFAPNAATAKLVLTVVSEDHGHHVSAVSALNEPQQYDVFYEVTYRFNDPDGKADPGILEPITSRISRTMNYDKTVALAMQRQELLLQTRLADELAGQVVSRLGFWPGR